MQGYKDYQEKLFISFQLSDRVPADNFYRRLKQELDLSFLRNLTRDYYSNEGQKSIDPVVFFKLMLIGYIENLCSDRKIIENASMRMDMLFFLDYDIDVSKKEQKTVMSNRDFMSPTDPDARISKKKHKPLALNYLGQISVDTVSHVICGAMADFADKRDAQSLPSVIDQTKANLSLQEIRLDEVLADTNYSSGDALKYLEDNNINGIIPNHGSYKAEKEGFCYFPNGDYYQCSQGVKLPFKGIRKRSDGNKYTRQYWTSKAECRSCTKRESCIGKRTFKTLEDTTDKPYYDRMLEKVNATTGAKKMKVRAATVEPVLGTLLHFVGMRKVYTKGIDLANKHVLLAATAYNIKKMLKFTVLNTISQEPVGYVDRKKNILKNRINSISEQLDQILVNLFGNGIDIVSYGEM